MKINRVVLIVLLFASPLSSFSQDKPEADQKQSPQGKENTAPKTEQNPPSPPNQMFVPSETISEDLSVPYPVDI
jgi:hypothetical protein